MPTSSIKGHQAWRPPRGEWTVLMTTALTDELSRKPHPKADSLHNYERYEP